MIFLLLIVGGVFSLIGMAMSGKLKRKFKRYSQIQLSNGMSGAEIAAKMLQDHGINDVQITSVRGQLTDHYNPINKTVNLSEVVYNERNAAAAAVAAHEVGHAVQHATAYRWVGMRSKLVPLVNISAKVLNIGNMFLFFGAGALYFLGQNGFQTILLVLIAANVFMTLFSLITLPVEFDASNRALAWMKDKNVVTSSEYAGSADALKWAGMTYVVAALAALANLLVYVAMFLGRSD